MADTADPIDSDESIYRRIPASQNWYDPQRIPRCLPAAFRPTEDDKNGLSLVRARFKNASEAALGRPNRRYFLAEMKARDILNLGVNLISDDPNDPGHLLIPSLNTQTKRNPEMEELQRRLAELPIAFHGPFLTQAD